MVRYIHNGYIFLSQSFRSSFFWNNNHNKDYMWCKWSIINYEQQLKRFVFDISIHLFNLYSSILNFVFIGISTAWECLKKKQVFHCKSMKFVTTLICVQFFRYIYLLLRGNISTIKQECQKWWWYKKTWNERNVIFNFDLFGKIGMLLNIFLHWYYYYVIIIFKQRVLIIIIHNNT